jgi:hypothetical protein
MSAGLATDGSPDAVAAREPWYRRRTFLFAGAIVVVLAIAVVTDLPTPTTHAADLASASAFVREVNTDLRPCGFALLEAYGWRKDQLRGSLSPSQRALVPQFLSDDAVACSYVDPSVLDLTSLESPETTAARPIGQVVATATVWVTGDALGAIEAIEELRTNPTNHKALAALARDTRLLARDRALTRDSIARADTQLHTHRLDVDLPVVTVPTASATPTT